MEECELSYNGENFSVPTCLLEDKDVFTHVISRETWDHHLSEEDRARLVKHLPSEEEEQQQDTISKLLSGENFKFGNPVDQVWQKLMAGECTPELASLIEERRKLCYHQYELNQRNYHFNLLQELLLTRRKLICAALESGSLDNLDECRESGAQGRKSAVRLGRRARSRYRRALLDCNEECGLKCALSSSDEEYDGGGGPRSNAEASGWIMSEKEYQRMLKSHKRRRKMKQADPDLDTQGITLASVAGISPASDAQPSASASPPPTVPQNPPWKTPMTVEEIKKQASSSKLSRREEAARLRRIRDKEREKEKARVRWEGVFSGPGCIYNVYAGDTDKLKGDLVVPPIIIDGPLPTVRFLSYFSVLRTVFESVNDRKGELTKIKEMARIYLQSPEGRSCSWLSSRNDWVDLTLSALCYLGGEVGAVSSFDPLPHFIPSVDFKDRIDHWRWIGTGRDSDVELLVLCNHWLNTLDKSLLVVDYTDYAPPAPKVVVHNVAVHPSQHHEVERFQDLEKQRYKNPHKAFTFNVHGYEASVGPVKGARPTGKKEQGSRARGHALLKQERPNCVTILSLVRDACSRLPNGEGTRLDLCVLVRDSHFLADNISETQLNNAVSGALDRLHYEKDPCVRYINSKKLWIYLHRGRTEEEFEHINWACDAAVRNRKVLMTRPKVTPKIYLKEEGGKLVEISTDGSRSGGNTSKPAVASESKPPAKQPKTGMVATSALTTASLSASALKSLVIANIVPGGKPATILAQALGLSPLAASSRGGKIKAGSSGKRSRDVKPSSTDKESPALSLSQGSISTIEPDTDVIAGDLPFLPPAASHNDSDLDPPSSNATSNEEVEGDQGMVSASVLGSQEERPLTDLGGDYEFQEQGQSHWLSQASDSSNGSDNDL